MADFGSPQAGRARAARRNGCVRQPWALLLRQGPRRR